MTRLYKIIDPKRMMKIKDARVSKRNFLPRKTKGLILIDSNDMNKINIECDIHPRKKCWELFIYDEKIAKDTKKIAKDMGAIAYMTLT